MFEASVFLVQLRIADRRASKKSSFQMENSELKNYLIGALICLVAALTIGVEPVNRFLNEAINRGTLRGVERCMDYSKSELLSKKAIKASCVQIFQKELYLPDAASGQAGPRNDKQVVGWGGRLENKTADHVTTWIRVVVIVFDAEGRETESFAETPIWIDPMGEAEFHVEFPELDAKHLASIDFCDEGEEKPKTCKAWAVAEVKGLSI